MPITIKADINEKLHTGPINNKRLTLDVLTTAAGMHTMHLFHIYSIIILTSQVQNCCRDNSGGSESMRPTQLTVKCTLGIKTKKADIKCIDDRNYNAS